MADDLILQFGYFGIFLVLVLGGLGLPVPEEAPIILAAILVRKGTMHWLPALGSCFAGVLVGDFVVYFLGYFYGEKVLSLPLTRKFLTKARESQIKGYFHRHGVKILILGRFAVGFRTAAYLTAGILRLPTLKLFLTDLCAASFSTLLMFGLGYWFAQQVEAGFNEAKHYITPIVAVAISGWLLHRYIKGRRQGGKQVGPPILDDDEETGASSLNLLLRNPATISVQLETLTEIEIEVVIEPKPPEPLPIDLDAGLLPKADPSLSQLARANPG